MEVKFPDGWCKKSHVYHTTIFSMASGAEVKATEAKVKSETLVCTANRLHLILLSIVNRSFLFLTGRCLGSQVSIWRGSGDGMECIDPDVSRKHHHANPRFQHRDRSV